MVQKSALITGIAGQDGPYLAELLAKKGYKVIGLTRADADLADAAKLERVVFKYAPDEIYNLAGQSSVRESFAHPKETLEINGHGAINLLRAAKKYQDESGKRVKFFQASSSEMFGPGTKPQDELTPFNPQSPYAQAKAMAHNEAVRYRREYGMFVCSGILFNHESPRRPESFVTRKITLAAAKISLGLQDKLTVGNIEVRRDWGYAPEYMEAAYLMLQTNQPDDYVIGTGEAHSIKDFIAEAFLAAGIPNWQSYVSSDPALYRPSDLALTVSDPSKAARKLGWRAKTSFRELVRIMVKADLKNIAK